MIGIKVLLQKVTKISQANVLDFLKKNKGQWFTARQLAKELNLSPGSIGSNLKRAIIHRTIQRREAAKRYTFEYSYLHQESMIRKKPLPIKKLKNEVGE